MPSAASARGDLLPPLAPPVPPDEDAELGVPAVGEVFGLVEVVAAIVAPLVARGVPPQDVVLHHVAELDGELLVDLLRLGLGNRVVGHCEHPSGTRTHFDNHCRNGPTGTPAVDPNGRPQGSISRADATTLRAA